MKSNEKIAILVFSSLLFFALGFSNSQATVSSQCTGSCGGTQTCTGEAGFTSDLQTQCSAEFGSTYCTSMNNYLASLVSDCSTNNKASTVGGNCNNITQSSDSFPHYGACAAAYAGSMGSSATGSTCSGTCRSSCDSVNESEATASNCTGSTSKCCVSKNAATTASSGVVIPTDTGLSSSTVQDILLNLLKWLLMIVGIIALIGFVISGIQYILAAGSEKLMETAKRNMVYSTIGVVVVLAGLVIVKAIDAALRATSSF